jgi:O-antigen chain-terminating methyltransferase
MHSKQKDLKLLIDKLPEQYQQIFNCSDYDIKSARNCEKRLISILKIYDQIKASTGRDLRVLDLGCAQGYFSFNLSTHGAVVTGVDCCDENINLCNKLAEVQNIPNLDFRKDEIQNFLTKNLLEDYDLVLGLSVFHHICHEEGFEFTQKLIEDTAKVIPHGIFELALKSEPLYWAESLRENAEELLIGFSFVNQISTVETHLSEVKRPIFFTSNKIFLSESFFANFDSSLNSPHEFEDNAHNGTRKYFISDKIVIKYMIFDQVGNRLSNQREFKNEVKFLETLDGIKNKPKLEYKFENERYGIIAREKIKGELLYKVINNLSFEDKEKIVSQIISQLIILEKNGLYHNDLRLWNILINQNKKVSLIDFGAISDSPTDCVWPSNIFHSFIILVIEIFSGDFSHHNPTRKLDFRKLKGLKKLQFPVVKILSKEPEELSFSSIQKEIFGYNEKSAEHRIETLISDQNLSLNLHIEKINEVRDVLLNLIFGGKKKNIQIDSLLREIQTLFYNKNNYITWLEKVNNEVSKINEELESKIQERDLRIKFLSEKYEESIIEHKVISKKYEKSITDQKIISKKYEKSITDQKILSKKYHDLTVAHDQMHKDVLSKNEELTEINMLNNNLRNKIYKVHFTKHLYRAWKRLSKAKEYTK